MKSLHACRELPVHAWWGFRWNLAFFPAVDLPAHRSGSSEKLLVHRYLFPYSLHGSTACTGWLQIDLFFQDDAPLAINIMILEFQSCLSIG